MWKRGKKVLLEDAHLVAEPAQIDGGGRSGRTATDDTDIARLVDHVRSNNPQGDGHAVRVGPYAMISPMAASFDASHSPILDRFNSVVAKRRDQLAIAAPDEQRSVTHEELATDAHAVSAALAKLPLPAGACVASLVGNRVGFFSVFLACLERKLTLLPLDSDTAGAEAIELVEGFGASAIVRHRRSGHRARRRGDLVAGRSHRGDV